MNIQRELTAAAVAAALAAFVGGCAAATVTESNDAATNAGAITIPTDSGNVSVPAAGATTGSGGGMTGPGEKDKQRGNTPPGTSRDGQGPAAGAIVDPSGAATGKR